MHEQTLIVPRSVILYYELPRPKKEKLPFRFGKPRIEVILVASRPSGYDRNKISETRQLTLISLKLDFSVS